MPEGGAARLRVRPHEMVVDVRPNGLPSIPARVLRVHAAGPAVRLELVDASGHEFQAQMSHTRVAQTGVKLGDEVFVSLREGRVYVDDYVI